MADTHHEVADVLLGTQELAGFDAEHLGRSARRLQHRARRPADIGPGQRLLEREHVHAALTQAHRIEPHMHRAARPAEGPDLARAGDRFEFSLERMRDALQVGGGQGGAAPQGHAQHRHIVNAFGFDHGAERAELARQPVLVGVEHVIQAHQGFGARHAHLELDRQHRQARPRDGVGVFNAGHLAQHLLGRPGHHVLHIGTAGARKRDQHVGHRHIDLRLFFARRHQHGKQPQQQGHQRQQRRERIGLKSGRNAPGHAQRG